jgi:hypothetical protein
MVRLMAAGEFSGSLVCWLVMAPQGIDRRRLGNPFPAVEVALPFSDQGKKKGPPDEQAAQV